MLDAKICGVSDRPALDAALAGNARFIGLVFFAPSPRHLADRAKAAALAAHARSRAEIVAVTVNATDGELSAIAAAVAPDWVQLHGAEPPARVAAARRFARKGVIKALPVATAADLAAAAAYEPVADMLLFDAKAPATADRPGGLGAAFDWKLLAGRSFSRPWFLSGGLTPENVAAAAAISGARLVDASSGLESAPGLKDPTRIAAFLAACAQSEPPR
ncbi:MAG: phosphoribosylanthranilate isomerase [Hydrogenophilaceae bacterium]|jgi:phosphoribosylanthranilate isomerase|nr:phosphoribosylanthranilate isomerase [Hydrogenophilaceae bacterium]